MTEYKSFIINLKDVMSASDYDDTINLHKELTKELHSLLSDKESLDKAISLESLTRSGYFRQDYTEIVGKPHNKWTKITGNKAKYHRMNIERVRNILLSMKQRLAISSVISDYNYDYTNISEIRETLISLKLFPTNKQIKNICRAGKMPEYPIQPQAFLDYTTGDKQIVTRKCDGEEIVERIHVSGRWVEYRICYPKHAKIYTNKLSKPIILLDKNNNLVARYAYEVVRCENSNVDENIIMGVDIGKIKPFSASIVFSDKSYSSELLCSKELEKLNDKRILYDRELSRLYKKSKHNELLLFNNDNSYLTQHYQDQCEQISAIKAKRLLLKKHMSWVVARDIVLHALKNHAGVIYLEDLSWLESMGGKWNHHDIQEKIVMVADYYGITVRNVSAKNTSRTDPFTGDSVTPNSERLIIGDGYSVDRDYAASLNIACRSGRIVKNKRNRYKKRKSSDAKTLKRKSCRDKHASTPKRPLTIRHKRVTKQLTKQSGNPIAVDSSVECSESSSSLYDAEYHDYCTSLMLL